MKKPNVIIGKKQIILSCLTLLLGVAVYLNYVMSQGNIADDGFAVSGDAEGLTYGEALYVGAEAEVNATPDETVPVGQSADDYFAQARLDKLAGRDEAVQTLQSIIGGGDLSDDEMVVKTLEAMELSQMIDAENRIESLVMAQGFSECIAYLDADSAKVIVRTAGLEASQAAAIKEIICGEVALEAEKIRIFEIN